MPYQTIKDFLCKIKQMLGSTSACKIFNCSISSEIVKKEQMIKCLSFSVEKVGGISENLSHKATVFQLKILKDGTKRTFKASLPARAVTMYKLKRKKKKAKIAERLSIAYPLSPTRQCRGSVRNATRSTAYIRV